MGFAIKNSAFQADKEIMDFLKHQLERISDSKLRVIGAEILYDGELIGKIASQVSADGEIAGLLARVDPSHDVKAQVSLFLELFNDGYSSGYQEWY